MPADTFEVNAPDRTNPVDARRVIEQVLPELTVRRQVLELTADLIKEANENPQNWGVTLYRNGMNLVVGGGYCILFLRRNKLKIFWLGENTSEPHGSAPAFEGVSNSRSAWATPGQVMGWIPGLRENVSALIRHTNSRNPLLQQSSRKAHSPGVLRYIEAELGISLPDPVYPAGTNDGAAVPIGDAPEDADNSNETMTTPQLPLNTILYGPPGTGKTYETARRAVEIIDGVAVPQDRAALMTRYKALQKDGRIAFVTFHQSYAYEDFVEGIRPVMDEDEASGSPRYQVVDGILKRLALNALGALLAPVQRARTAGPVFAAVWQAFLRQIAEEPERTYPGLTTATEYHLEVTNPGGIRGRNVKSNVGMLRTTRQQMEAVWDEYAHDVEQISTSQAVKVLGSSINGSLIACVYRELKRIGAGLPADAPTPDVPAEEKALAYLKQGEAGGYAPTTREARFVLIIDEINRGNISKILGELITLLEDDKRLGRLNELTAILPYSRQPFGLPPNLYVVGTMNTADKSLALLDVALRRRFAFHELAPDFGECHPALAPTMRTALDELNRRITLRKDRDHRIGHAFFMGIGHDEACFDDAFTSKVIPLLQEYFFNDWDGLRYVLGESEKDQGFIRPLEGANEPGVRNRWQWFSDAGAAPVAPLQQLLSNYKPKPVNGTDPA